MSTRRKQVTDDAIRSALAKAGGNVQAAADHLGCCVSTVRRRAAGLGIENRQAKRPTKKPKPAVDPATIEDAQLWKAYQAGDAAATNELATKHLPLVYGLVGRLKRRTPDEVDYDDLLSAAQVGLLEAMAGFQPERGLKFATYAAPRIRGAMLDAMRKADFVPRLTRQKRKAYDAMVVFYRQEYGRKPTEDEILDALGWSGEQAKAAQIKSVGSLDAVRWRSENGRDISVVDQFVPAPSRDLRSADAIAQMTRGLDFEIRVMLWAYFALGHTMKEIGVFFLLSESRVSQRITKGLRALRAQRPDLADEVRQTER